MTETQRVLPETPNQADLLSDLLGRMHLSGVVLFSTEFREPWGLVSPAACELSRMLPFRTEHIIPFHIIAEGGCWLELKDREPVWLEAGDAVLLPYGDMHVLHGRKAAVAVPAEQLLPPPPWPDILRIRHGGDGECTRIVCGFVQCDELLFHPLLRHLPALMHVSPGRDPDDAWLAGTIRHTAQEATRTDPGGRSMLPRLTELMFVEILRQHMQAGGGRSRLVRRGQRPGRRHGAEMAARGAARRLERGPAGAPGRGVAHGAGGALQAFSRHAADALPDVLAPAARGPAPEGDRRPDEGHRRPGRL